MWVQNKAAPPPDGTRSSGPRRGDLCVAKNTVDRAELTVRGLVSIINVVVQALVERAEETCAWTSRLQSSKLGG